MKSDNNSKTLIENLKHEVLRYCKQLPYAEYILEEEFIKELPFIYYLYPYLYIPTLKKELNEEDDVFLQMLSICGFLIYRSALIKDRLIDNEDLSKINKMGYANYLGAKETCIETAIKILSGLFSENSEFWLLWKKRKNEYIEAIELDNSLIYGDVDKNTYRGYADYKSALGKLAIDALFVHYGCMNTETYEDLLSAHKYFSTSLQIMDDFSDIVQDFNQNQFNWCLNLIIQKYHNINPSYLKSIFYSQGFAEQAISFALEEIDKAIATIKEFDCKIWMNAILHQRSTFVAKSFIINNYIQTQKKKTDLLKLTECNKIKVVEITVLENAVNDLIKSGICGIVGEQKNDFLEMKHIMWLPPNEGFQGVDTTYVGDVFQRAILGCFFCELKNKRIVSEEISELIERQILILEGLRRKAIIGGWSYLPDAPEIAPDADDLGQIIQFFSMANRKDLLDIFCKIPIKTLLTDCTTKDGGIKTWIIPITKTPEEEIQTYFNQTKWGEGPDTEVMANFLIGLLMKDANKYKEVISKGGNYLIKKMDKEGYWKSRWYYGNYYGTYICKRLLESSNLLSTQENEIITTYLCSSQNKDGGWGLESSKSDPLNTSFALLSLSPSCKNKSAITKGIDYLTEKQCQDGLWDSVEFIKPRVIEPYGSRIITSIFAIKALLQHS